jgi:hypothetical protein
VLALKRGNNARLGDLFPRFFKHKKLPKTVGPKKVLDESEMDI